MSNKCRCCGNKLMEPPILIYKNMPQNAQHFLKENELVRDKGVDLELYQCVYCGLIQIQGEPVPYFRDVIRSAEVSEEMHLFRLKQFREFIQKYQLEGKRIVEIGAGCGEYMKIFQETGAEIYGIENKNQFVNQANKRGLKVYKGFLESEQEIIYGAPYDAAYCLNFLEHIPDPNNFIKAIFGNLKENAVVMVEVPSVNMLLNKNLFSEFISDHLMYFTKETLQIIMAKNGFEILECREIWYNYILSMVVRKRKQTDMSYFYEKKDKIAEEIKNYIQEKKIQNKKIAVWGAGHQALTVLSLTQIEADIEYVIDSAVFKQHKYTPATHIPIVSPKVLEEGTIGAVLVLAAGYSDEVVGIMKRDYQTIDLAVLRDYGIEIIS